MWLLGKVRNYVKHCINQHKVELDIANLRSYCEDRFCMSINHISASNHYIVLCRSVKKWKKKSAEIMINACGLLLLLLFLLFAHIFPKLASILFYSL